MLAVYTLHGTEVGTHLGSTETLDKALSLIELYEKYGSPFDHVIDVRTVCGTQETILVPGPESRALAGEGEGEALSAWQSELDRARAERAERAERAQQARASANAVWR